MAFKEGMKCAECGKPITDRKSWVKYKGKYFHNWKCQGSYEREHGNERVDRTEVEKSLPPSKRMKDMRKEKRGLTFDSRSSFFSGRKKSKRKKR